MLRVILCTKKRHTLEYLRTMAHLRPRTNTISAVSRIRSVASFAVHQFYQSKGFTFIQTPLITSSDCEGAGEMFRVTSLPLENALQSIPTAKRPDAGGGEQQVIDFDKDFFGKPAFLTVSGQLAAEAYACALSDVYTFGPTFRAEPSQTTRHLAEFHMIEPEMAFIDNAEAVVKFVTSEVLAKCGQDLEFLNKFVDTGLMARLSSTAERPFHRVPYREAIQILQREIAKIPSKWQHRDVHFGSDLASEHEKWLSHEFYNKTPVFVHNYPRSIKPFYMHDSDDGETVDCFDLLVPGIGELVGGSQREDRYERLLAKIEAAKLDVKSYEWYLDLRRYGSVPHSGYGIGFERLVCYLTGVENIRDAIAFPRTPGNIDY